MIDVTIIVPVYNVENYLEKCFDSLVNQDYDKKKYEIYAINDGSSDKSLEILKKYSKKYKNITLKDLKKNKGVSYARNIGIKNAKGEYLMFCDSDDTYEKNAISKFMKVIKKEKCDFLMSNYYITSNKKDIAVKSSDYFKNKNLTKEEIVSFMTLTSCSKIIKKELFIDNNVYYPEDIKRCEELTVIPVVAYYAKKPIVIDDVLYHYYQRKTSASNNNAKINIGDLSFFDETFLKFENIIDKTKYREELEFRAIDHLFYGKMLVMLKANFDKRTILNEIEKLNKKYPEMLNNKYLNNYNKFKLLFIKFVSNKNLLMAKIFAKLHQMVTG